MDGKRQDFLRFGVAGMGVGASSVLTPIACSPFSGLGAGADIDPSVRARFSAAYPQARVYASVEDMCADPGLDAIWISTPNRLHADHAGTCSACEICHSAMLAPSAPSGAILPAVDPVPPQGTTTYHSAPAALTIKPPIA